MPDIHTHIIIRRPDGKVESVGRHGQHEPHKVARMFEEKGLGTVLAVRHIMSVPIDPTAHISKATSVKRRTTTLAVHHMKL